MVKEVFTASACGFFGLGQVLLYISPMYVIDNAEFIPRGSIDQDEEYGAPKLSGDLIVSVDDRELKIIMDLLKAGRHDLLEYSDRSAHSQLHLQTRVSLKEGLGDQRRLVFPMDVISLQDTVDWLNTIRRIRLKAGRLFLLNDTAPFDAQTLERLWHEDDEISFPQGTTIDPRTGVITTGIDSSVEYDLDTARLNDDEAREYALQHGRRGLKGVQDVNRHVPPGALLHPHESLVTGMRFSTGPHIAIIRRQLSNSVRHLGAVVLDDWRSTGTDNGHLRQGEYVSMADEPIAREDIRVDMQLYPGSTFLEKFRGMSRPGKQRVHREGAVLSDLVSLDEGNLKRWFTEISTHPNQPGLAATVLSVDGVTDVPWQKFYARQKRELKDAVVEGRRTPSVLHGDLTSALQLTSANGRMIISHHLPSASHLEDLAANGVRSFVFRAMRTPKESFHTDDPRPRNNFYLNQSLHDKLMELERQGCEFIWWPKSKAGDEQPRTFYKGFFVKPEAKDQYDRFRQNGIGVAMFGTSSKEVEPLLRDPIQEFGDGLRDVFDPSTELAIMDGNGPGVMQVSREMAKNCNYLRVSFGMDFEQVGEVPDFGSEALVLFNDDQIEYRQTFLQYLHMIPVCNYGGDGTDYERVLAKLKGSLAGNLPLPMYWVDGRPDAREHFYQGAIKQQESMTEGGYGFPSVAKKWVPRLIVPAQDYAEVLDHMQRTLPNLDQFWRQAGIPKEALQRAYKNHVTQCQKVNIQLPNVIAEAYHRFCQAD